MSLDTLDAQQKDKLEQYQTITQIQDLEEALGQLIEYDWNLERAIQHMYENNSKESREELEQEVANSTAPPHSTTNRNSNNSTRPTAFQQQPRRRPSLLLSILFWPFGMAWNITWSILSLASRILMARPAIAPQKRDPRVLAAEFIESFQQKYGARHIEFFKGGYSQALEKARKDLRFMLVLLQSPDHDDTDAFCRETLTSNRLIQYIQDKNILVWAGNVRESEGHKVSYTLQATTYPFMALIALQGATPPKMTVIERIEGACHVEELISQIDIAIDRHGAVMARLKRERQQRDQERQLRVDQDAAYHASLEQDRQKARKAQEEEERKQAIEREKRQQQELALLQEKKRQQFVRYLYTHLSQEPTADCAKLSFRLADGDRVIRRFSKEATVEDLYRFVEVYPLVKENAEMEKESPPEEYTHNYKFSIHSPYPKIDYEPSDKKIFDIKSLWPSATLVVENNDEDEDEE